MDHGYLVYEKVVAWLRSKDPAALVGRPRWPRQCPLASYLAEAEGVSSPAVYAINYEFLDITSKLVERTTPDWAQRFLEEVDSLSPSATWNPSASAARGMVTAGEALSILEGLERGAGG